ncbi:hypothetical protein BC834DRAFT_222257 [Gloeopeniophorella convolvens]|nr:hypothetical protein BC834DRAFT_222257 [Gloeopeniophorella convolvens]
MRHLYRYSQTVGFLAAVGTNWPTDRGSRGDALGLGEAPVMMTGGPTAAAYSVALLMHIAILPTLSRAYVYMRQRNDVHSPVPPSVSHEKRVQVWLRSHLNCTHPIGASNPSPTFDTSSARRRLRMPDLSVARVHLTEHFTATSDARAAQKHVLSGMSGAYPGTPSFIPLHWLGQF